MVYILLVGVVENVTMADLLELSHHVKTFLSWALNLRPAYTLINCMDIYLTASTCGHELVLPTKYYEDEAKFKEAVTVGLLFYGGYGKK